MIQRVHPKLGRIHEHRQETVRLRTQDPEHPTLFDTWEGHSQNNNTTRKDTTMHTDVVTTVTRIKFIKTQ
jgi:hypothetical protein